jgi:uncharacterized protein YndB with AHSA1/START domain/predicted enzyme related to lactoylglutathione lyase
MLGGLRSAFLSVDDVDSAKAWYSDFLGITPYFDEPFYVGFDIEGYELGLIPGGESGVEAVFAASDPGVVLERAVSLGATLSEAPRDVGEGIVTASYTDPFGNRIGLIRNPHFAPHLVYTSAEDRSGLMIHRAARVSMDSASAWELWATEDGLSKWWTSNVNIDLRPGGAYEIYFNPEQPPGDRGGDWCRVLSFLPGRMLSFTWNAPPELKTRPLHTWVVLTFESGEAGTVVDLTHLGWPQSGLDDLESDWLATFEYFDNAWTYVMSLFVDYAAELS